MLGWWLVDRSDWWCPDWFDWLADPLLGWMASWSVALVVCLIEPLRGCFTDRLLFWMVTYRLVCWYLAWFDRLVGCFIDWLLGWMVSGSVGRLLIWLLCWLVRNLATHQYYAVHLRSHIDNTSMNADKHTHILFNKLKHITNVLSACDRWKASLRMTSITGRVSTWTC